MEKKYFSRVEISEEVLMQMAKVSALTKHNATASLNNLIKWDSYPDVKYGIKLGYKNIGWNGLFYTFPYFLTFLLKRFLKERERP